MTDKILIDRSVVEQALDALEDNIEYDFHGNPYEEGDDLMQVAAAKLRAALEQRCPCGATQQSQIDECAYANCAALEQPKPLPSPVWRLVPTTMTNAMAAVDKELRHTVPWIRWEAILAAAPQSPIHPPALEQPVEQDPVAWLHSGGKGQPLYLHPQPKREPLVDEKILEISFAMLAKGSNMHDFARAIERAHGITGDQE